VTATRNNDAPAFHVACGEFPVQWIVIMTYGARAPAPYHSLCPRSRGIAQDWRVDHRALAWSTSRSLCKDDQTKICAWTSTHKTVLTARPEGATFL
jgi:hypothetical protein